MPDRHSGLHKLKAKKNALAEDITRFRAVIPAGQAALARLRQTCRAMHLADCYMRGRQYSEVERTHRSNPIWGLVAHFVDQHGGPIVPMPPLDEWFMTNAA